MSDEDQKAFEAFVAEHLPGLLQKATWLTGHHGPESMPVALDLVNAALKAAWARQVHSHDSREARLHLSTLLANAFLDWARQRRDAGTLLSEVRPPESGFWNTVDSRDEEEALQSLDPKLRELYTQHCQGRTYRQLSEALGLPLVDVGLGLVKARRALRTELKRIAERRGPPPEDPHPA